MNFISKKELAKKLKVSRQTIANLIESKKIDVTKWGGIDVIKVNAKYNDFVLTYNPKNAKKKKQPLICANCGEVLK